MKVAQYRAVQVKPGTKYADEPSGEIRPGWYVVKGGEHPEDGENVIIGIEQFVSDAETVEEEREEEAALAHRIADLLNAGL